LTIKQIIGALLVALAIGLGAWSLLFKPAPDRIAFDPDNEQLVARGEAIYLEHCASCHGADLAGQSNWRERGADGLLPAPPHDPSGHTWHHPDSDLFALTKYGVAKAIGKPDYKSAMPAYEGVLSDEEIVAALSYIKSTWPAEIRERHDLINGPSSGK